MPKGVKNIDDKIDWEDGVGDGFTDQSTSFKMSQAGFNEVMKRHVAELKSTKDRPKLICMSLKKSRLYLPQGPKISTVECEPFTRTPEMEYDTAAAITKRPRKTKNGVPRGKLVFWLDPHFWEGPDGQVIRAPNPVDDKFNACKEIEDKVVGGTFVRCAYADCPNHPRPHGIPYSIVQAHKFMAGLTHVEAIQYFMSLDPRTEITKYGHALIQWRIRQEAKRLGLTGSSARDPNSLY